MLKNFTHLAISAMVREGLRRFDVLELPQISKYVRFGTVEPPRTYVKELQLSSYLCNNVVREGSRRVKGVELSRTIA